MAAVAGAGRARPPRQMEDAPRPSRSSAEPAARRPPPIRGGRPQLGPFSSPSPGRKQGGFVKVERMVGADVHKRILHALGDTLTDDTDYAFIGIQVSSRGGGDIACVTIGPRQDGDDGSSAGGPGPRPPPGGRNGHRSRAPHREARDGAPPGNFCYDMSRRLKRRSGYFRATRNAAQRTDSPRQRRCQLGRQPVPLGQQRRVGVADLRAVLFVGPHEQLERQVQRREWDRAVITGVPAAGSRRRRGWWRAWSSPTACASARWSITSKTLRPLASRSARRRVTVSANGRGLGLVMGGKPGAPPNRPGSLRQPIAFLCARRRPSRRARGVIVAEALGRLEVPQRHPDPDRQVRLGVVPALRALDDPGPIRALSDLRIVGLQLRLPGLAPRCEAP